MGEGVGIPYWSTTCMAMGVIIETVQEYIDLVKLCNENRHDVLQLRWSMSSEHIWKEILAKYPDLKWEVAQNKKLPDAIKRMLAVDEDFYVRSSIARKHKIPEDLYLVFARDESESIRSRIAVRNDTPMEALELLALDSSEYVAQIARDQLDRRRGA